MGIVNGKQAQPVQIHIDDLVVHAPAGLDRDHIAQAIRDELTRVAASGAIEPDIGSEALAAQITEALQRRLS